MNRQLAARAEAAVWITRLHAPDRTSEMEAGFHQWLNECAQNRLEFEELTDIWAAVGTLPKGAGPRLEHWEHSAESQELQNLRSQLHDPPDRVAGTRRSRARNGLRIAAAVACVLAVIV